MAESGRRYDAASGYTVWAKHDKVRRWLPLFVGLTRQRAADEMLVRQNTVRQNREPCRFAVRPDGKEPDG